jgi:hypothetical protein
MYMKWLYSGAMILMFSIVLGILAFVWAFQGMVSNESAGIGAIGLVPVIALFVALVGTASGILVMLIGLYKLFRR